MVDEIYTVAAALCSVKEGEEPLLRMLCQAAEGALLRQEEKLPEICRESFLCAAGCMAAADLLDSRTGGSGGERFAAGDVSVTLQGTDAAASRLRQQAKRLLAPYCGQDGFAFLGVRG